MWYERANLGREAGRLLLLSAATLFAAPPAPAETVPADKDLVGTWDIKDKKSNSRIGKIELKANGQFEMTVGRAGAATRYPATPKAKWKLDGSNFEVVYDPDGRGKQVYIRGKIKGWTKTKTDATFELPLREVNRLPVKEGDVLLFDK